MTKQEAKSETDVSNRMWATASFVGVLIVVGLPLWWKTTEVYRVSLPYDKISAFDKLPQRITTELVVHANDESTAAEVVGLIEKAFEDSDVINLKVTKTVLSDEMHHTLSSFADEADALEEVAAALDVSSPDRLHLVQRKPLHQDAWLSAERVLLFRDADSGPTVVEVLKRWVYHTDVLRGAAAEAADAARRTRFPPGDGYHVVLSVVQPRPDAGALDFDAVEAVEDYIGTFVDELSMLHNFTLKSQWLYMLDFDFQARYVADNSEWGHHYAVRRERLHVLLTRLEERAATHVSERPAVNLALYAVPCQLAPLAIYDARDEMISTPVQAFMSPKWGGVVLSNPTRGECRDERPVARPVVRVVMGTFLSQLRKLMGITDTESIEGAHLEPLRSVVPRRWEIDNLLRLRTLEQLTTAKRTLQSLAQLLGEISNIVINDEVGACINSGVESIAAAHALAGGGGGGGALVAAHAQAQAAARHAERAFTHPSLLALLYFPDDQKYAIYVPLFLPIMFPVVLSLKNLFRWFRGTSIHKEKAE